MTVHKHVIMPHLPRHKPPEAHRVWHPKFPIPDTVARQLLTQARLSRYEQCGLLTLGSHGPGSNEVYWAQNISANPLHEFAIAATEYEAIAEEVTEEHDTIIGLFHSHPNGFAHPSMLDIDNWPDTVLGWRYWIVTRHEIAEWRLAPQKGKK